MTTEILINVAPRENRAALIENGVLMELFVERQSRRGIVSNLYKGRVQRVLPGMQAAFIDVGLERTAFLHAADIAVPSNADSIRSLLARSTLSSVQARAISSRITKLSSAPFERARSMRSLSSCSKRI